MFNNSFFTVEYRIYSFNGENLIVRADFWDAFDACPSAMFVRDSAQFGVGTDDFTMNHSVLGAVWNADDKRQGEPMMITSTPAFMVGRLMVA